MMGRNDVASGGVMRSLLRRECFGVGVGEEKQRHLPKYYTQSHFPSGSLLHELNYSDSDSLIPHRVVSGAQGFVAINAQVWPHRISYLRLNYLVNAISIIFIAGCNAHFLRNFTLSHIPPKCFEHCSSSPQLSLPRSMLLPPQLHHHSRSRI